jgi:hypothetical protein
MARPSRRLLSAYAVPGLAIVAVGFVVAGVRLGTGVLPLSDPRQPAPAPVSSLPAAQISGVGGRVGAGVGDAELAAAVGAIGDLVPTGDQGSAAVSPPAVAAAPSPSSVPQPAAAPGPSPPGGGSGGPGGPDPPSVAGDELVALLQPVVDLTEPVTAPVVDPLVGVLGPIVPSAPSPLGGG